MMAGKVGNEGEYRKHFHIVPHKSLNDREVEQMVIERNRKQALYVLMLIGAIMVFIGVLY